MKLKIKELFSENEFSIPHYQRDYAWEKKNFNDLWEDLEEAMEQDNDGHFLGTIVVAPNLENNTKLDIIDGQQRLTTIFMLMYVLIHSDENLKEYQELLKKDGNFRLEIASDNQEFFKELLEKGKEIDEKEMTTQGQERLYEVFSAIFNKVKSKKEKVKDYLKTLLNMNLMQYEEKDPGRAIRTFQSINDRGVPLRILDKLKAILIYYSNLHCDGELDMMINNAFGNIFKTIAKIEKCRNKKFKYESDLFRHHAGTKAFEFSDGVKFLGHYKASNSAIYEEIKNELDKFVKSGQKPKLKSFIENYTKDLEAFHQAFLSLMIELNEGKNLSLVKLFKIEKISSSFYGALVRLKIQNELDDELIHLMMKADIIMLKTGLELKDKVYGLIQNGQDKESFKKVLLEKCGAYTDDAISSIITNAYNISQSAFYYLFFEQNCSGDQKDINNYIALREELQKEHIISQKTAKSDELKAKALGFDDLKDLKDHLHNYGNLLALENRLNAKASNLDLYDKAKIYVGSKISFVENFDVKNFNKVALTKRNEKFEEWVEKFFKEFKIN